MSVVATTTANTNSYLQFSPVGSGFTNLCQAGTPFTFAALVKLAGAQDLLYTEAIFPWVDQITGGLGANPSAGGSWSDDSSLLTFNPTPALGTTDWYVIVATNSDPGTAGDLMLYSYDVTTAAGWQQSGALTGQPGDTIRTPGNIAIGNGGNHDVGNTGATWALAGLWAGVALSSTQVHALVTNLRTSDWYNNAGGKPDFLVECTTLTPTDIGANPSTFAASSNLSLVADTSGWDFDGHGSGGGSVPVVPGRIVSQAVNRSAIF